MIDICILVLLAFFLVKGVVRGLLREICSLLGLVLGGVFAFSFYLPVAQLLQDKLNLPGQLCVWVAFLAIFLAFVVVFGVVGFVLHRFVKMVFLGGFNRLAGAVFGIVQGVVVLSMLLLACSSSVAPERLRKMTLQSELGPPFVVLGDDILTSGRKLIKN